MNNTMNNTIENTNETNTPKVAWTERRKAYRRAYQLSKQYQSRGIPAVAPDSKTWVEGTPLMTAEYSLLDNQLVEKGTEGSVFYPSVEAKPLYEAFLESLVQEKLNRKEEVKLTHAQDVEDRKEQRKAEKLQRDADKAIELKTLREENKAKRNELSLKKAAESERLANLEKARKQREKMQMNNLNALNRAKEANLMRINAIDSSNTHALNALKSSSAV